MRVEALHPGVALDQVRAETGFELLTTPAIAVTEPPTQDELTILRALDPERRFLG
jgi:glutaconate CoA-transferase, subunit B